VGPLTSPWTTADTRDFVQFMYSHDWLTLSMWVMFRLGCCWFWVFKFTRLVAYGNEDIHILHRKRSLRKLLNFGYSCWVGVSTQFHSKLQWMHQRWTGPSHIPGLFLPVYHNHLTSSLAALPGMEVTAAGTTLSQRTGGQRTFVT
jgi:hypothetical protein